MVESVSDKKDFEILVRDVDLKFDFKSMSLTKISKSFLSDNDSRNIRKHVTIQSASL